MYVPSCRDNMSVLRPVCLKVDRHWHPHLRGHAFAENSDSVHLSILQGSVIYLMKLPPFPRLGTTKNLPRGERAQDGRARDGRRVTIDDTG